MKVKKIKNCFNKIFKLITKKNIISMVNEDNRNNNTTEAKVILTDEAKKEFNEREKIISDLQIKIKKLEQQKKEIFKGAVWVEGHPDFPPPCYYACKYLDKENYLYCTVDKEHRKCGDMIIKDKYYTGKSDCKYCNIDRIDEYFHNFYDEYYNLESQINKI